MDQSQVNKIKNELTDSATTNRLEIQSEIETNPLKLKSDSLTKSEIYIKIEPKEDESQFPVVSNISDDLCPSGIKMECLEEDLVQNPVDVDHNLKVEPHSCEKLEDDLNKNQQTEGDGRSLLDNDEKYSKGSKPKFPNQIETKNKNPKDQKIFLCEVCKKTFRYKQHLQDHWRIHTGEKPYSCEDCDKSFGRKYDLNRHRLTHSGIKPYVCEYCDKVFSLKTNLNKHRLKHIGDKPFSCNECDKAYTQKQFLLRHIRIHSGVKPYMCDICEKTFTHQSNLTYHKRVHTGERPYICDICTKTFADPSAFRRHKLIHTT